MKILVSWLREFVPVDTRVEDLADVLTMRGFEVSSVDPAPASVQSDGEDAVLDLEVTTNRPDCLNVLGVAREVSTVYDTDLKRPTLDATTTDDANEGDGDVELSVVIEDTELCPRYVAAVAEVTVGPSPGWLAARLEAADVRPINNVVDITNYVMLELGHPMHAFDLEKLGGRAIHVRRAAAGETVRTLDGEERALAPEMLVIADADRPQAVAGVMGGADSEVSGQTRLIALESAYFRPTSVRRTGKRLALSTDASYRFERGADIDAPTVAMRRALTLLAQTGAGRARGPIIDEYPEPRDRTTLHLRHSRIGRILGIDIDAGFVSSTLGRLGFVVSDHRGDDGQSWDVSVPTYRVDVSREIDLIEEVARHYGYDRLPSTFPPLVRAPAPRDPWQRQQDVLRRVLTASGCSEAITYSFIEREAAAPYRATDPGEADSLVAIANPLSEKFAVLRPSVLPGVIDSLIRNRRREHRDVRLFEIGQCFDRRRGETGTLGVALIGTGSGEHWSAKDRPTDLFDIKGIVERTCDAVGVRPAFEATVWPVLVEGRASAVTAAGVDGQRVLVGRLGQLSPTIASARGLPNADDEVYVAELDLAMLDSVAVDRHQLTAARVPRYPSIVRDLALVVDRVLPAAAVRDTIQAAAPDTLVSVREFDRYEGKRIPAGCVSLALRLTFRASDRTLTDAEAQEAVDGVVAALEHQHGATLR